MKIRIITAICMAIVLIPVAIFSHTVVYPITMALLSVVGAFEMLRCIGLHKTYIASVPCIVLAGVLPFAAYFASDAFDTALISVTAILLFWLFAVSLFSHGTHPVGEAAMAFFGLIYVIWGFGMMTALRQIAHGAYLYLLPFLGAWMSDSFAYFTGRLFGRHKLIPDVSPKKTVEGAVGGVVFAMASFALYGFVVSQITGAAPHYMALVLLGLPVSLVSIIGDLIMSLIKRRYEIKDYGRLFPGHGGVLDRFDSVLATAIALYLLCTYTTFFRLVFQ
ncbi:MAG: phosphatidate cytidylyltransferase [Clostridia bacterium]|nr:phosphatidate cytidylyltransferase [Clostridia bacterium]